MSTNGPQLTQEQFSLYHSLYTKLVTKKITPQELEPILGQEKLHEFAQFKQQTDLIVMKRKMERDRARNAELKAQMDAANAAVEQAKQDFAGDVKQKLGSK